MRLEGSIADVTVRGALLILYSDTMSFGLSMVVKYLGTIATDLADLTKALVAWNVLFLLFDLVVFLRLFIR